MVDKKILQIYGIIVMCAISIAMHEALFIPFFCNTLAFDGHNHAENDQMSIASFAMILFGIGDIIGGAIIGQINDKFGG